MASAQEFKKNPDWRTLLRIVPLIRGLLAAGEGGRIVLIVAIITVSAGVGAAAPLVIATLLDRIQNAAQTGELTGLSLIMLGFVAAKSLSRLLGDFRWLVFNPLAYTLMYRFGERLAEAAVRRTSKRGMHANTAAGVGEVLSKVGKAQTGLMTLLYQFFIVIIPVVIDLATVGIGVGTLLGWDVPIAIALAAAVYSFFLSLGRTAESTRMRAALKQDNRVMTEIGDFTGHARLVQEYGAAPFFRRRVGEAIRDSLLAHRALFKVKTIRGACAAVGIALTYGVAMIYAYWELVSGPAIAGGLFLVIVYVDRIIAPLNNAASAANGIRNALISVEFGEELLNAARMETALLSGPPANAPAAGPLLPSMPLAVVWQHPDDSGPQTAVLAMGGTILVRGPSGAGKTSLLFRLYEGALNGTTVSGTGLCCNELDGCAAASRLCYLDSVPETVSGTLRDNILLGQEDVIGVSVLETVWRGVWSGAPLDKEILPLETDVAGVSAGERQRVGLARMLLHRPGLLLLDEATNALDLASERGVWTFMRSLLSGSTIIVAAHRTDTFRDVDQVIDVDDGRVTTVALPLRYAAGEENGEENRAVPAAVVRMGR